MKKDAAIPGLYKEDGFSMEPFFLTEEAYKEAIGSFVVVCTDVGVVDYSERKLYLARRRARPADGQWWFIGGRTFAGEAAEASMIRCFERETGITMQSERFIFVCMNRYLWKERQQEPIDQGCDSLCYTFLLELTPEERREVGRHLEVSEYQSEFGLRGFSRAELVEEGVLPQIIDFYNSVFS